MPDTTEYTTLIGVHEAAAHLDDPGWAFIDCRFVLGAPGEGRRAYEERHIRGAAYADVDGDLSGLVVPGRTGRHPLPAEAAFDAAMSRLGVGGRTQVVAYDERTGAMAAARLWWLLKWAGHDRVAVLDGGLEGWLAVGLPVAEGSESRPPARFAGRYRPEMVAGAEEIRSALGSGVLLLVDARARDRFRGENETVDHMGGHIPGAISLPHAENLGADGRLLAPARLRERIAAAAGSHDAAATVVYCGSGVTAAHDALAYARAGLGVPRLYPGSWSEWIADPGRPIATGEE